MLTTTQVKYGTQRNTVSSWEHYCSEWTIILFWAFLSNSIYVSLNLLCHIYNILHGAIIERLFVFLSSNNDINFLFKIIFKKNTGHDFTAIHFLCGNTVSLTFVFHFKNLFTCMWWNFEFWYLNSFLEEVNEPVLPTLFKLDSCDTVQCIV